ncbi:MAG: hypothetical protein QM831_02815 [Kofleriaceae bacterium]
MGLLLIGGIAWAASEWDTAKDKAESFEQKNKELRHTAVEQSKRIVDAICHADHRKDAASTAVSDARWKVSDKFSDTEHLEREAIDLLDKIHGDHSSDASSKKSDIQRAWDKSKEMTGGMQDGRSKLADWMIEHGDHALRDHADRCNAREYSIDGNRAACLMADSCKIIEFAQDNSNAISNARDRARRIQSDLHGDELKSLIRSKSEFSKCEKFEVQVDCFKLCPDIRDDNTFSESSPSWRTGC